MPLLRSSPPKFPTPIRFSPHADTWSHSLRAERRYADTPIHSYNPFATNSARHFSIASNALAASGPSAVTEIRAPVRISAVMMSMILTAEHVRPFDSSVMLLLKRIAQRTISLVGRACRPDGFVTHIVRRSLSVRESRALIAPQRLQSITPLLHHSIIKPKSRISGG
jgi:hypothetical protein